MQTIAKFFPKVHLKCILCMLLLLKNKNQTVLGFIVTHFTIPTTTLQLLCLRKEAREH